jgi:hypothetical protein
LIYADKHCIFYIIDYLLASVKTQAAYSYIKNIFMYTTYHFKSAADITVDVLNAIKTAFQEKPIVVTIEEEIDETAFLMTNPANKSMLLKSIAQDKNGEMVSASIPSE